MIKCAAIKRIRDGRVWTGKRHDNCIRAIISEGYHTSCPRTEFIQGFVTDTDVFVDRCQAHAIAVACGQISNTIHSADGILISDDLY
jgi:hypothetical protein